MKEEKLSPACRAQKRSRGGRWSWAVAAEWLVCLAAELFLNSCFLDTVLTTLFRTAVETAITRVHKLLRTGGVPTSLTLLVWRRLTVSSVLFWRRLTVSSVFTDGSEGRDELLISNRPPPPPPLTLFPVPNKPYGFRGRDAPLKEKNDCRKLQTYQ